MKVYQISGPRLGDLWASLNYYNKQALLTGEVTLVSVYSCGCYVERLMRECLSILEVSPLLTLTRRLPTEKPVPFCDAFKCGYSPTIIPWRPDQRTNVICYQFNVSHTPNEPLLNARTPPESDIVSFLQRATSLGYKTINFGDQRPLRDCMKIASTACLFVGAISGFAEFCTSIGIPMQLAYYGYPLDWAKDTFTGRKCVFHQTLEGILP